MEVRFFLVPFRILMTDAQNHTEKMKVRKGDRKKRKRGMKEIKKERKKEKKKERK